MKPTDRTAPSGRRGFVLGTTAGLAGAAAAAQPADEASTHRRFIARAVVARDRAVAAGDQPYGAVIVKDGVVVTEMPSRVVATGDPTAHAEMEAIRDAARILKTRHLGGAVLYSTSIPCPMCQAAAYWAGVSRFVYGDPPTDGGAPRLPRP